MPLYDRTLESRDDQPMLLVADGRELPSDARVWGTGGWLPPDQREALDWLTLARFSGWDVNVVRQLPGDSAGLDAATRWIVIACDPDALNDQDVAWLASRLLRGLLFGVASHDPVTLVAVTFVLAAAGLLACWIPAVRAARVDPVTTLRAD